MIENKKWQEIPPCKPPRYAIRRHENAMNSEFGCNQLK